MPNVGGVQYPYTPEGIAAAQQAERQIGKMGPASSGIGKPLGPPLTSPSHPMAQRRVPDLRPYQGFPIQRQLQNALAYQNPQGYRGEDMGWNSVRSPSDPSVRYPTGYSDMMATKPVAQRPFQNVTEQFSVPANYGSSPSNPNYQPQSWKDQMLDKLRGLVAIPGQVTQGQSPWQRPITQAPRGQTIRTTDPGAGYGQSPSGPTAQRPRQPANYGRSPSNPNWTPGG